MNKQIENNRNFMKCPSFLEAMKESDQSKNVTPPPHGKEITTELISLQNAKCPVTEASYLKILDIRRSVRNYDADAMMTQSQLAFLLHSAQGIQEYRGNNETATLRPVPSGGARHPFETYVAVKNVEGLESGIYYYAPVANVGEKKVSLTYMRALPDEAQVSLMLMGQAWAAKAQAIVFLTCVPYRSEWRYVELSHRVVLIDLGHVGQNLMLSAASMGLGSCCMAAYDQALCDEALNVDGTDEYTVYAVAVGVPK